ncbi:MAG TPA: ATP-binding protein [Caldisericia bacterium]|nr:ATP-binding protein [Caldisericia bacterium]
MRIQRVYDDLDSFLVAGKVLVVYGPRRVGKTTLIQHYLNTTKLRYRFVSGDDISIQKALGSQSIQSISELVQGVDLFVIDEAQRVPFIGYGLKIMVDHNPSLKVITTGSASFDLQNKIGEPLVGRKRTLRLYPISQKELNQHYTLFELREQLSKRLIFGSYPEVITQLSAKDQIEILHEIVHSLLLKDILELERVKGSAVLHDLLRLLAFQVGNEVSHQEIGMTIGLDKKTVGRYLDLFEKAFLIFNLRGFSRNLRKEITKKGKYYFFDNGIRNALIANFNELSMRNDVGSLWENFLFIERMKKLEYSSIFANSFFWRTWDQKEIDYIEEKDGALYGYEFKWKSKNPSKGSKTFLETYSDSSLEVVTPENFFSFIL